MRSISLWVAVAGLLWASAAPAAPRLTIYSSGDLAWVQEPRTLETRTARDTVRLEGIPERLDFTSARLTSSSRARVQRLAYRYDVASGDELINRARGNRVRVSSRDGKVTEGTLIAADPSWLVVRSDDGSFNTLARQAVEDVRLASAAGSLTLRPTLEAVLEGGGRGRHEFELAYLTGGLTWSAEHALVRSGEGEGVWSASVTVTNHSGVEFADARLALVAGEPHRASPPPRPLFETSMKLNMRGEGMAAAVGGLTEQGFADYHLYTLGRPATLRNQESQSLAMLEPRPIKLRPRYLYRGGSPGVMAQLEVVNNSASGLGQPLPAGRVRFFERDGDGNTHFTGETQIRHTPEDEKLTLDVGMVFDLAAERRETYHRRVSDREREYGIEIKLRNRKKTDVTIVVEEGLGGDSEVLKPSHPPTRKDANTVQFTVPIPAGKEVVLSYGVRVRF